MGHGVAGPAPLGSGSGSEADAHASASGRVSCSWTSSTEAAPCKSSSESLPRAPRSCGPASTRYTRGSLPPQAWHPPPQTLFVPPEFEEQSHDEMVDKFKFVYGFLGS